MSSERVLVSNTSAMPAQAHVSPMLLGVNLLLAVIYFLAIAFYFPAGNQIVFAVFVAGEVFHLWQLGTYLYTIWGVGPERPFDAGYLPSVDVFITVAGEPVDIVAATVRGALAQDYAGPYSIVLLNDGLVAGKDNWREIEKLAEAFKVECLTRTVPGGAKAGNINNALRMRPQATLVAVFDADHVPEPFFLSRTVGFFTDERMGFVQSPQYYHNYAANYVSGGAWEQQDLFFGPILRGKDRTGSVFMCGTNMVMRRAALNEVGGMCETNIAEDFMTSLFLHERGWKSTYVPEVLARGLAPEDFLSYYKQQHRWARGSLEIIFRYNPLFRRGLTLPQKIQYLASASYYLTGPVALMNGLLPILFFFTGIEVFTISTNALAMVFIPYICLSLYVLQRSSSFTYSFRALSFSTGSFWLQITALYGVLTGRKTAFAVTSKQQLTGNFLHLVVPHFLYAGLTAVGIAVAVSREGLTASVLTNASWALITCSLFAPMVYAATARGQRTVRPAVFPADVTIRARSAA